ncbi:MAG: adenylate/guanylate cyclase domain-containing protein [Candidatus Desulfaltia sp.]|nr:adenylate/guanylate cyclase domain-containing protein [Candidatus Desulfaltia sp.]
MMFNSDDENWVTSKQILLKTDISRATLNNYIKAGIIPKPVVKKPAYTQKSTKRIGHFPKTVFERIEIVKRLKQEGRSMDEIVKSFINMPLNDESTKDNHTVQNQLKKDRTSVSEKPNRSIRAADEVIKLTLENIKSPAYLINRNFEIEWINREAEDQIFKRPIRLIDDSESRNVFKLLFDWEFHSNVRNWEEIVTFHLASLKPIFPKNIIPELYDGISESTVSFLEKIYDDHPTSAENVVNKNHIKFVKQNESVEQYEIYTLFFREGIFFVYIPSDSDDDEIRQLLFNRQRVINELLGQRMPSMVSLCVLVADIQDSVKISAELPPFEYFELINQLWKTLAVSFEKHQGIHGKHSGDGFLYYFIKKPGSNYILDAINCALELRKKMTEFSNEWKLRKKWTNALYLNIGINEGKEFFGSIRTSVIEYTALGDTINYAGRLSDLARFGSIWATKNFLNKLSHEELNNIDFGIMRKEHGKDIFVKSTYSRVMDLLDPADKRYIKFMDIVTLPVAEIINKV